MYVIAQIRKENPTRIEGMYAFPGACVDIFCRYLKKIPSLLCKCSHPSFAGCCGFLFETLASPKCVGVGRWVAGWCCVF